MAFGDKILTQARNSSIQLEELAVAELRQSIDSYLPPSWGARKMIDAYASYANAGTNSNSEYLLMRKTFSDTKGQSHHVFSNVLATHIKPEKHNLAKTMFGEGDWDSVVRGAVRSLRQDGMWKAKFMLPDHIVQSLRDKGLKRFEAAHGDNVQKMLDGTEGAPIQIKSSFEWISTFEEMYEVAADPVFLSIVQDYLGVPPIFDTPVMFLNGTAPVSTRDLSDVAQLYHHDMHRLAFVKLFMYLTDVDEGCGPHAMIPGTHLQRPDVLWADGRHTDEKVANAGILDKEVRITGKAGTLFLVDTRALHKGVHPETKSRLMAQVQYANSLFGKPLPATTRTFTEARKSTSPDVQASAALVKKYAEKVGVRYMQALI